MRKIYFLTILILITAISASFGVTYEFYGRFTVSIAGVNEPAGGVAIRPDGGLYFVTFNVANSRLVFVPNAIQNLPTGTITQSVITTVALPAGRGLDSVQLDNAGNIYISGTGTGPADSRALKFNSAHVPIWSMDTMPSALHVRLQGIVPLSSDVIAVSRAWTSVDFRNAHDFTLLSTVTGGTNFGRQVIFNTNNNDIYISRSGDWRTSLLRVYSGGSPTNLAGYTFANELIYGATSTQWGTATQPIAVDQANNLLITNNRLDNRIEVFSISGSGIGATYTLVTSFTPSGFGVDLPFMNATGLSAQIVNGQHFIAWSGTYGTTGNITSVVEILRIPPLSASPSIIVSQPGAASIPITISGGVPGYTWSITDPSGGSLATTAGMTNIYTPGTTFGVGTITVIDTIGQSVNIPIKLIPTSAPMIPDYSIMPVIRNEVIRFDLFEY